MDWNKRKEEIIKLIRIFPDDLDELISQEQQMLREFAKELWENAINLSYQEKDDINKLLKSKGIEEI